MTDNINYFIGKAVTIITTSINRQFNEAQNCDYFVGIVCSVDSTGIMTQHPTTGCRNYYFYPQICSISEEQVLDSSNSEDVPLIQEIEKKRNSPYVDIDDLTSHLK